MLLGAFGPVLGTALLAIGDPLAVMDAANNVVAYAGKVPHTAAAYQHDRVFLQIVPFAWDVDRYFLTIAEPHACDLAQRGIWFLWCHGSYGQANSFLERIALQNWTFRLGLLDPSRRTYELVDGRH